MGMSNVDQAYQLRQQYCVHYFLRNQKWWFAIYFGALNYHSQIFMFYIKLHDKLPPYSHYEFIREICLAWIDSDNYCQDPTSKRYPSVKYSTITKSRA